MFSQALKTLVLEDDEDHARLLELELNNLPDFKFCVSHCQTVSEAIDLFALHEFDLILTDYWLQTETADRFLQAVRQKGGGVPVIVTSAANNEYVAAAVTRSGAHRYIRKDDLSGYLLRESIKDAMCESAPAGRKNKEVSEIRNRLGELTPREREIASLIGKGLLSKQIASELDCAEGTVNLHRSHILRKLDAQSVADVVRMVMLDELHD